MTINKKTREQIYNKYNGMCAYSGKLLEIWQVDHITPKYLYKMGIAKGDPNHIDNLIPCEYILNHYKRGYDLEEWRNFLLTFHLRLKKLPKNTNVENTKRRKLYMFKVAELMDITMDKPFTGKFYFETL